MALAKGPRRNCSKCGVKREQLVQPVETLAFCTTLTNHLGQNTLGPTGCIKGAELLPSPRSASAPVVLSTETCQ